MVELSTVLKRGRTLYRGYFSQRGIAVFDLPVVHLYVDGANGSDHGLNLGTVAAEPLRSLARLEELLPNEFDSVIIHLAPLAPGEAYAMPRWRPRNFRRLVIWGDWIANPAAVEVLATGTFAAPGTPTVWEAPGLGVSTYRSRFIRIVDGSGAGVRRLIGDHDNAQVRVVAPTSFGPDPGAGYEVFRPSVRVDVTAECVRVITATGGRPCDTYDLFAGFPGGAPGLADPFKGSVVLVNLALVHGDLAGFSAEVVIRGTRVAMYGCEFTSGLQFPTTLRVTGGGLALGCDRVDPSGVAYAEAPVGLPLLAPDAESWRGYGLSAPDFFTNLSLSADGGAITGYAVSSTLTGEARGGGRLALRGNLRECRLVAASDGLVAVGDASDGIPTVLQSSNNFPGTVGNLVQADGGRASLVAVDMTTLDAACVAARRGSVTVEGCSGFSVGGGVTALADVDGAILLKGSPGAFGHPTDLDFENGDGAPVNATAFGFSGAAHLNAITGAVIARSDTL